MCSVWLKICSPHWIRTPQILLQCILLQYSSCIINYNCRSISAYILYFATCTNFTVLIFTHKLIEIHSLTGIVLALLLQYMSQNNTSAISYIGFAHQIPYVSTTQGLAVTYLKIQQHELDQWLCTDPMQMQCHSVFQKSELKFEGNGCEPPCYVWFTKYYYT